MSENEYDDFQIESSNNPLNQAFIYEGDFMSMTDSQLLSQQQQELQCSFNGNLSSICSNYSAWNQSDLTPIQCLFGEDAPIVKRSASTFQKCDKQEQKIIKNRGKFPQKSIILDYNQTKRIQRNEEKNNENTQSTQIADQDIKFSSEQKQSKTKKIDKHKNKKSMFHKKQLRKLI